jgi:hypothetical protein
MSCCNKETPTTKQEFLIQKGKNFKEFISKYKPDQEVSDYMEKFDEKNILSSILSLLVPLQVSGGSETAILELMAKLTIPASETQAVKEKIGRYFSMFVDVVITAD